jgi:hypothetical protein
MRSARAKGSKEDGTNLTQGVSQPSPAAVTPPGHPLDPRIIFFEKDS